MGHAVAGFLLNGPVADQMKMGSVAGTEFFRHEKRNIRENPFVTATEKPETIAVSGFSFAGGRI